jgi:hypothetical protein
MGPLCVGLVGVSTSQLEHSPCPGRVIFWKRRTKRELHLAGLLRRSLDTLEELIADTISMDFLEFREQLTTVANNSVNAL